MAETPLRGSRTFDLEAARKRPVIGLVATEKNGDRIAGAILRARRQNYQAIVTAQKADLEGLTFARLLGAKVVDPPHDWAETVHPKERLAEAARREGFPGFLFQPDPSTRVDFSASQDVLMETESFAIDARTDSIIEQEPTVLVGIPAYNEAATVGPVVEAALQYADALLVVDDGSTDDTARRAEEAGATVIRHETNRGYGAALKSLFEQAKKCYADRLVVLDGDGQHDANDIPRLLEAQQETGAEIVVGCRFGEEANTEMPVYRRLGLGVVNVLTNLSLGVVRSESRIRDTQSGFRAYDSRAIESLATSHAIGDRMSASTDILYHAHVEGYDIEEVPSTIDYDVADRSNHNPIQHGLTLVMNIVRVVEQERPITVLGIPGIAFTLIGFGLGYWTLSLYVPSGSFPVGLALAASLFTIVGILTAFTAIILHSLAVHGE